ncbi:hypothetical protein IMG5_116440, partial [Ichthyophthirius multifiliis]
KLFRIFFLIQLIKLLEKYNYFVSSYSFLLKLINRYINLSFFTNILTLYLSFFNFHSLLLNFFTLYTFILSISYLNFSQSDKLIQIHQDSIFLNQNFFKFSSKNQILFIEFMNVQKLSAFTKVFVFYFQIIFIGFFLCNNLFLFIYLFIFLTQISFLFNYKSIQFIKINRKLLFLQDFFLFYIKTQFYECLFFNPYTQYKFFLLLNYKEFYVKLKQNHQFFF